MDDLIATCARTADQRMADIAKRLGAADSRFMPPRNQVIIDGWIHMLELPVEYVQMTAEGTTWTRADPKQTPGVW